MQECGAGLVQIRTTGDRLAFAAPRLLRDGPVDAAFLDELTVVLGINAGDIVDSRWIDNGPDWVGILLKDAETVLSVEADFNRYTGPGPLDIGLIGPHPDGSDVALESRALFSDDTDAMREDPVTGSLNAAAGQWRFEIGRAASRYLARQGTRLGRSGEVQVEQDTDSHLWVGGATITRVEGILHS